jgi:hypothetical protein
LTRRAGHFYLDRMLNPNAIAVSSTARFWWRGRTLAARWRD